MISFIVPAHNEEKLLPHTLESLHAVAQSIEGEYEIIVVDDASSDRTREIADDAGAQVVRVSHRQISATRNSGARASTGDPLIFVDADTIVPRDTIVAALNSLRGGAVGGGARITLDGSIPLYGRIIVPIILELLRSAKLAPGCFMFCTRRAFESIGGFDENLFAGEEITLSRELARVGSFDLLDEPVITSGRKFRLHSASQILGTMFQLLLNGENAIKNRHALSLWYGKRRDERDEKS